jgi:hypothetical protein
MQVSQIQYDLCIELPRVSDASGVAVTYLDELKYSRSGSTPNHAESTDYSHTNCAKLIYGHSQQRLERNSEDVPANYRVQEVQLRS